VPNGPSSLVLGPSTGFYGSTPGGSDWVKVQFRGSNAGGTSAWGPLISLPKADIC